MAKELLKNYDVTFERLYTVNKKPKSQDDYPVDYVEIKLCAYNVDDAIHKAWQSVTITPQDYEIVKVHKNPGFHYRIRLDTDDDEENE